MTNNKAAEASKKRVDAIIKTLVKENDGEVHLCLTDTLMIMATLHNLIRDDEYKGLMKQFVQESLESILV